MKNKAVWLTIGIFAVTALLLLSCGPKAAPTPTPAPAPSPAPGAAVPTPTPAGPVQTPVASPAPLAEKPRYGGTLNIIQANFVEKFDIAVAPG